MTEAGDIYPRPRRRWDLDNEYGTLATADQLC